MEKYGSLSLYNKDLNKIYTIDNEDIQLLKKCGYALIVNPDETNHTSTEHEYFPIREYFYMFLAANHIANLSLNIAPPSVSLKIFNESSINTSKKSSKKSNIISPPHTLRSKVQKTANDCSNLLLLILPQY